MERDLGVAGRAAKPGDISVLVGRCRLPKRMCCREKASTIVRRIHFELVGHSFEQIGEGGFRLSHLPVISCGSHSRNDPLLFVADLRAQSFVAHIHILADAAARVERRVSSRVMAWLGEPPESSPSACVLRGCYWKRQPSTAM